MRHRTETATPIENRFRGERLVALSADTCELIDDYLASRRLDVLDEHGREPLLTRSKGRISRLSVQNYCYRITRSCVYAGWYLHDLNPDEW